LIRAGTDSSDADSVVLSSADVVEKIGRAAVGGQEDVRRAVVVDIGAGRAARHQPLRESHGAAHVLEPASASVVERERTLGVAHLGLNEADVRLDVSVGDEKVLEAVQVVVEEEKAEREREQAGAPD